jgi:hypothetical protein
MSPTVGQRLYNESGFIFLTTFFLQTEKAIPTPKGLQLMSTRYEFSKETIQTFSNEYGISINLTAEQNGKITDFGRTPLQVEQIETIANELFPDTLSMIKFLEDGSHKFHPLALTLYVLNDDLWNIMSRKPSDTEKMLPMTTIPWFFWEKEAESRSNPAGVKRLDDLNFPLAVRIKDQTLSFSGKGGDFAGLLEGRIVDPHKGIRPMFIPGDTGPKKNVANYESQQVQITLNTQSSDIKLYPKPMKELDYMYSEHPKVFYEHGIQLSLDGEDVVLKIGKRRDTTLRGKVFILMGKNFEDTTDSDQILLFHVWLVALRKMSFL